MSPSIAANEADLARILMLAYLIACFTTNLNSFGSVMGISMFVYPRCEENLHSWWITYSIRQGSSSMVKT